MSRELPATLDAELEAMAGPLAETRAAMGALTGTAAEREAKAALGAFQRLQGVTVDHLNHEETETEDVYVAKRDSPEIKAMGKAFAPVWHG